MYVLTIFNKNELVNEFYFDEFAKPNGLVNQIKSSPEETIYFLDDYGHAVMARPADITLAMVCDLRRNLQAKAACEVVKQTAQRNFNAMMESQPKIIPPHAA